MFKPGTNEDNVSMTDVLCDFCHRAWTEDVPFIEGHRGCHMCAHCISVAYSEVMNDGPNVVTAGYFCRMSRESSEDRETLKRGDEPGWRSPVDEDACISRMCIRMAVVALERDPDFDWQRPT